MRAFKSLRKDVCQSLSLLSNSLLDMHLYLWKEQISHVPATAVVLFTKTASDLSPSLGPPSILCLST